MSNSILNHARRDGPFLPLQRKLSHSRRTISSFLDLPAELRVQVYAYVVVPSDAPFSAYHGLYFSCKQVKNELDTEGPRLLHSYISDLNRLDSAIQLSTTSAFSSPLHLHFAVNTADTKRILFSDLLELVLAHHVYSITISHGEFPKISHGNDLPPSLEWLVTLCNVLRVIPSFAMTRLNICVVIPGNGRCIAAKWWLQRHSLNPEEWNIDWRIRDIGAVDWMAEAGWTRRND